METIDAFLKEAEYYDPQTFADFQKRLAEIDLSELRIVSRDKLKENLEESFYADMINLFVEKGTYPATLTGDPICDYIISVMRDSTLQYMVLTDEVQARIFKDSMMKFVDSALKRKRFNFNRKQSEAKGMELTLEWSNAMRRDGQQALIDTLAQSYDQYGFRSEFFRKQFESPENVTNQAVWESLYKEYHDALNEYLREETRKNIGQSSENAIKNLKNLFKTIPEHMQKEGVTKDEFEQAWGMMGGEWNEYDFKRYVELARVQQTYPELLKLAGRMGRTIDPDGEETMWVGSGNTNHLEHSSKSDIQGITFGRELDSLLPIELVQMSDDDFDELFLAKYTTHKLQSFQHRSQQLMPNKLVERKRAKQKGPMIVCIDTSGSMEGQPLQLTHSLVLKLISIATNQKRDLYLIAFSVSARPIDVRKERVRLMDFFRKGATGDTKADKMMELTINLLAGKPEYMSADVAIVGDFRMPLVPKPMLDAIRSFQENGTRFYGLQIGAYPDNKWPPYLNHVYKVGYTPTRKY